MRPVAEATVPLAAMKGYCHFISHSGSMGANSHLVSAVVVNWNGARHLEACLPSLLRQSHTALEVLILDNGSSDESESVARSFAGVRWVPLGRNLGLASAMNKGAALARGDVLLFLNNDMRLHPDFVRSLLDGLLRDQRAFAADALQYDWEGKRAVHLSTFLAFEASQEGPSDQVVPGLYLNQRLAGSTPFAITASAANTMVRKDMFFELGGFDERLPAGYEDLELCWRAWLRGWRTVFVPSAVCWHRVGGSSRSAEGARVRTYGMLAGRLLFATKLLPLKYAILTWAISIAGLARDLAPPRRDQFAQRRRALEDSLRCLFALIRERRQIYRSAQTTPGRHLEKLLSLVPSG